MSPFNFKNIIANRHITLPILIEYDYNYNMNCEECSVNEGKFILVVDIGKTEEKDQNIERERYYCLDCFKQLMNS